MVYDKKEMDGFIETLRNTLSKDYHDGTLNKEMEYKYWDLTIKIHLLEVANEIAGKLKDALG